VLTLLLLLLLRPWLVGAFDNRVLCRLVGVMNGSAPGMAASVSPLLEFGARATTGGVGNGSPAAVLNGLDCTVHVQPGAC